VRDLKKRRGKREMEEEGTILGNAQKSSRLKETRKSPLQEGAAAGTIAGNGAFKRSAETHLRGGRREGGKGQAARSK